MYLREGFKNKKTKYFPFVYLKASLRYIDWTLLTQFCSDQKMSENRVKNDLGSLMIWEGGSFGQKPTIPPLN